MGDIIDKLKQSSMNMSIEKHISNEAFRLFQEDVELDNKWFLKNPKMTPHKGLITIAPLPEPLFMYDEGTAKYRDGVQAPILDKVKELKETFKHHYLRNFKDKL